MKSFKLVLAALVLLGSISCSNDDNAGPSSVDQEIKSFVWSGMNLFYYWQSDVPNLDDSKATIGFDEFIDGYSSPESFFDDLIYRDDRFSWIVDDFEELEASFQGVSKSFGYELGLVRETPGGDDLFAFIEYIIPGGPADQAGLTRGMVFNQVDGTRLTIDNYISLLFESDSYTIRLANIENDDINQTNDEISLVAVELTENPIFLSDVIEVEGQKVGYLVYNQFINSNAYHEELNNVFGEFNAEGISDMVLDLRYNGGGSLTTSRILASMLNGGAGANDLLGTIIYNEKLAEFNADLTFLSSVPLFNNQGEQTSSISMNRLNLNRIYILISGSSASASEFIIAGLDPFMNVTLVGDTTVGKNVGSVTLYDSEDFLKSETLNPNHTYAIQPIISQIANSVGFTDYIDGFAPDSRVREVEFLEDGLAPLGELSEPLLAEALGMITGAARSRQSAYSHFEKVRIKKVREQTILLDGESLSPVLRDMLFQ